MAQPSLSAEPQEYSSSFIQQPRELAAGMSHIQRVSLFLLLYFASTAATSNTNDPKNVVTNATNCPCGYYDAGTKNLFTEATIVYFNETTAFPIEGFVTESYEHNYQKGFTSLYRQGASPSNVRFGNYSSFPSLELLVSPSTPDHVVIGGGIRTARRDHQYGSFRSLLRSPPEYPGGSALSMLVEYNQTESFDTSLMNTNDPANAWIGMQVHQTVDRELGANYSGLTNNITSPWNYTEYRIDWTPDEITYYIGGNKYRVVSRADDQNLPSVPAPLHLKHWSVGDYETMQGPPAALSIANVGWIRLFFNSSTMTDSDHSKFDLRCQRQAVCGMDDTSLRGSSQLSSKSEQWWEQAPAKKSKRVPAIVIAALCIAVSSFLVLNALLKRIPWDRLPGQKDKRIEMERIGPGKEKKTQTTEDKSEISQLSEPMRLDSVADDSKPAFTNPFIGGRHMTAPGTADSSATTFSSGYNAVDIPESHDGSSSQPRVNKTMTWDPRTDALAALEGSERPALKPQSSDPAAILSALRESPSAETAKSRSGSPLDSALINLSGEKVMQKRVNQSVSTKDWVNPFEVRNSGSFSRQFQAGPSRAEVLVNRANGSLSTALEDIPETVVNRKHSGSISPELVDPLTEGSPRRPDGARVPSCFPYSVESSTRKRSSSFLSPDFADIQGERTARKRNRGSTSTALEVVTEHLANKKPDRGSYISIAEPNTPPSGRTGLRSHASTVPTRSMSAFSQGLVAPFPPGRRKSIGLPPNKERIDYLAGLLALSSMIITVINFCHTFSPALVNPDAQAHYPSETWARKTIAPYVMNSAWFGPFLLTSSRFLVSNFLRSGDLLRIAEKTVRRIFRLMVPIVGIALLEYFLMDAGATQWLEYLPSITFSIWPFVSLPNNLGHFINEMLALMYVIPNALPQVIKNYCTNVLWTIPVQLQGSWTVLLCVIVIYEIRTPWKRFGYYIFSIVNHWYALSWGSYLYFGILLADFEITYKYRKWLYSRPVVYYPVVILSAILSIGGLSSDLATQWTGRNNVQLEYGIHPDNITGLPIAQTSNPQTAPYFTPQINGLIFAVGTQAVIELSPLIQNVFSIRPLTWLSRHTYTIYLIHGFIFWSLGSWLCIAIAVRGWPYWLNILIVAIACYGVLIITLPALTPIVEVLGAKSARHLWYFAYELPAPRRATLFPFPQDMLYLEHTVVSGDQRSSTRKGSIMHRRGTYELDEPEQSKARSDRRISIMHRSGVSDRNDSERQTMGSNRRVSIMHRRGTYDLDDPERQTTNSNRRISVMHRRGTYDLDDPERQTTNSNRRISEMHRRETSDMMDPATTEAPDRRPSIRHRRAGAPELENIDTQRSENYRNNRHISIYEPEESPTAVRRVSIYDRRSILGSHGSSDLTGSSRPLSGISPRTYRNFSRPHRTDSSHEPHDIV
ncbi:MAG: hypothetical protein M1835_004207 [Candelina submexicana]|nr:MAG: hypothetical protein M1835_004207 [Candelina submexicana]